MLIGSSETAKQASLSNNNNNSVPTQPTYDKPKQNPSNFSHLSEVNDDPHTTAQRWSPHYTQTPISVPNPKRCFPCHHIDLQRKREEK